MECSGLPSIQLIEVLNRFIQSRLKSRISLRQGFDVPTVGNRVLRLLLQEEPGLDFDGRILDKRRGIAQNLYDVLLEANEQEGQAVEKSPEGRVFGMPIETYAVGKSKWQISYGYGHRWLVE